MTSVIEAGGYGFVMPSKDEVYSESNPIWQMEGGGFWHWPDNDDGNFQEIDEDELDTPAYHRGIGILNGDWHVEGRGVGVLPSALGEHFKEEGDRYAPTFPSSVKELDHVEWRSIRWRSDEMLTDPTWRDLKRVWRRWMIATGDWHYGWHLSLADPETRIITICGDS